MSLLLVLSMLSVSACEAELNGPVPGRLGLGLGVRDSDGGVVVACVVPGSAAAEADLHLGQRILRAGGHRVHSVHELEAELARAPAGSRLDLDLAQDVPRLRVGVTAIGGLLARDTDTQFALLGGYLSLMAFDERFAWLISGHYTALGAKPGTGRNVLSLRVGLEGSLPLLGPVRGFTAVVAGPNFALSGDSTLWPVAPATVGGRVGLRWGPLDVFSELGLGPADGFGVSLGVTIALGLGQASGDEWGEGPVRVL